MKLTSIVRAAVTALALSLVSVLPTQAQSVPGQGTWETTLLGRDINLNAVSAPNAYYFYDTTLDVTWLRNANANGLMNWPAANTWAAGLVTGSGAAAISDWRLPIMAVGNPDPPWGYNVPGSSSEMASLFFVTLGNTSSLVNAGSFQNMQSNYYWIGTEYAPDPFGAWFFATNEGFQFELNKYNGAYAMAVHPGDVLLVPEPQTYPMLLLGFAVLCVIGHRRSQSLKSWAR